MDSAIHRALAGLCLPEPATAEVAGGPDRGWAWSWVKSVEPWPATLVLAVEPGMSRQVAQAMAGGAADEAQQSDAPARADANIISGLLVKEIAGPGCHRQPRHPAFRARRSRCAHPCMGQPRVRARRGAPVRVLVDPHPRDPSGAACDRGARCRRRRRPAPRMDDGHRGPVREWCPAAPWVGTLPAGLRGSTRSSKLIGEGGMEPGVQGPCTAPSTAWWRSRPCVRSSCRIRPSPPASSAKRAMPPCSTMRMW